MNARSIRTAAAFALLSLSAAVSGCDETEDETTTPPAAEPVAFSDRGLHAVGFETFTIERADAAPLAVKAWYPSDAAPDAQIDYAVSFKSPGWQAAVDAPTVPGNAAAGAAMAAGQHPAIVFSHGFGMNPEWYGELVEHYASRGFVVLAPEHEEFDWFAAFDAAFTRPVDVSDTLDLAERLTAADGAWAGAIDFDRVALVGHSYGGYTALAVAGGRIETDAISAHCGAVDEMDPRAFLCAPFMGREADIAAQIGLDAVPEGLWPSMKDDRIAAIVPISADAWFFGEDGMAGVDVPVMTIGGTEDFGAPWDWSSVPIFAHSTHATRYSVGLEGGSHFLPVNVCADLPWIESLADIYEFACFDPAWDRRDGLDVVKHYSTAFLEQVLRGDATAEAALQAEPFEAVRFEAAGR